MQILNFFYTKWFWFHYSCFLITMLEYEKVTSHTHTYYAKIF